ncbi:uncharacterized protein LOC125561390 [Nematostella vectensis]|uniref:uncharacterized protein LOC125561390 n=1 Tax=Nematostella vectensis TaxID=45351 RepID=UPI0020773DD4|nr:uncharacterized protein LOC125561390 [Nematostella vectensis]
MQYHQCRCDAKHQCKNGGTCVGKNTCSCSRDYTGPQCSRRRLGTAINPAPNAKAILDAGDSGGSGLYWIQPPGEPSPALTYCDMDYQGGGWMLASYGFVHATSTSPLNKAIPNMNNPMGYLWEPEARASSNGLVNLTHGAVMMARAANHMIMAAGGNPSTGGIDSYSYVWSIDLRQNKIYNITFANHNRFNGATGSNGIPQMHLAEFVVQGLKGETGKYVRYALAESLGATWGDSYPTGYGFVNVGVEFGTITQGPFFPSVHSGDGGSNMNYQNKIFQPDVPRGSETYVHKGWYSATATDKIGQTSIWFK